MKWSIYKELIEDVSNPRIVYLFNSLREKYFVLDSNLKDLVLSGKDNADTIANLHPELYGYWASEKFLVPEDKDEVSDCINKINKKFSSDNLLRITINPTLDCNLRCWYCYESHIPGSCMEEKTIEALGKFIGKCAQSTTLKEIQLSFFGGEPLLKYNQVVKPIAQICNKICHGHNKLFMLSFTTNGVCLTPKVVKELKELAQEVSVQVAFNGSKPFHNAVKCFGNGKGCYDIVKKQLGNAIENGVLTNIRCNYTLANIDSFKDLIDDFKDYWNYPNVRFTFHKVWQEAETTELSDKREALKQYISETGIQSNIASFYGDSLTPCYADFDKHIVVNYNGDIYKCTARDFKPENNIGYLSDEGEVVYNDKGKKRFREKLAQQCFNCQMLPICTICFQQRSESADGSCPVPQAYKHAEANIHKYFYDVMTTNRNMTT